MGSIPVRVTKKRTGAQKCSCSFFANPHGRQRTYITKNRLRFLCNGSIPGLHGAHTCSCSFLLTLTGGREPTSPNSLANLCNGSIPVKKAKSNFFDLAFFIQAAGLVWHQCACALYGIAKGGWHHAQACIFIFLRLDSIQLCELIPFARVASNSIPQQVADSIHG